MKVMSVKKSFWFMDSIRQKMILVKEGTVFDAPTKDERDRKELFSLLPGHVLIVDDAYVPLSGKYVGVHNYQEEKSDGSKLKIVPNQPITLNQEQASRLMALNIVRPEKSETWRPSFLISGNVSPEPAKRMFDAEEPTKDWIKKYGRR